MNGVTVNKSGFHSMVYHVKGVNNPSSAVNQAKKLHAKETRAKFEDITARKIDATGNGTLVVVIEGVTDPHRLAAAEPRQQPETNTGGNS